MKRSRWTRFILLFILVAPIAILVFGGAVMLLWNNVLVPVLHVSTVTFWQAFGILVLSKVLFGSFGGRGRSGRYSGKERMMWNSMTPEQKEKFREEWKSRCGRRGFGSWNSGAEVEQTGSIS